MSGKSVAARLEYYEQKLDRLQAANRRLRAQITSILTQAVALKQAHQDETWNMTSAFNLRVAELHAANNSEVERRRACVRVIRAAREVMGSSEFIDNGETESDGVFEVSPATIEELEEALKKVAHEG